MKRVIIELENLPKRSITPVSGERLELAVRKYAGYLQGTRPVRVFVQEYDARLSSRFRYTPAPQLLEVLLKELRINRRPGVETVSVKDE
jgi:hypothetical protein